MRESPVRPRVRVGVVVYLAYLAVFYGVWIATGIDYAYIGSGAETLLRWYVLPLAAGTVVIVVLVSRLGWWQPALFDRRSLPRWVIILPALLAVAWLANLLLEDTSAVTPLMWIYLVIGSVLVGFAEEMITRGQLVVALRSRYSELGVWALSTTLYALLHLPNTLFGTGVAGLMQVPFTFLVGTVLYLLRRSSGSLIWAMALHALWDFSTFAAPGGILALVALPVGIVGVIVAIVLLRRRA